jgi:hypothetical protein
VQTIELTPTVTTQGFVYSGKINGLAFTYTVGAAATIQIIVEALAPIITALAGVTATEDNTKVIVTTDTAGTTFMYTELVPELRVKDATADPGVATDLAAIFAENFDWFGLSLASNSEAEVNAAAAWLETKRRIMSFSTADFGAKDGVSTTDVLSDLKTLNNFNTGGWYHQDVGSQLGLAIMGQRLTSIPGSDTWAHKKVVGVPVSKLSAAEEAAVQAKNGNTYTEIAGNGNTFPGKVASGEYFDIVRYVHFLFARIQERVIFVFQNNEKIAYTDAGIALLAGAVQAILISHTKKPYNALSTNPLPVTTAPAEADIDPADKINRVLPGVEFSAKLAGAIHAVEINGTLTA